MAHVLTQWPLWTGLCLIHEELPSVGQHNLQIKAFNKGNTYLSSLRSGSFLGCHVFIQKVIQVDLVMSIKFQVNSLAVSSHMSV